MRNFNSLSDDTSGELSWELDRDYIFINYENRLGEGAFGLVFQGFLREEHIPSAHKHEMRTARIKDSVAVKLLRETASRQEEMDFLQEIETMKILGAHVNI
ncbi:hypothetical protein PMAYCL1PPCAC_26795, partial [Pristionchus mayeri]